MAFVEGFVVPVPKRKLAVYRRMAKTAGKVWRKYGATAYVECVAASKMDKGKRTSFPRAVKLKPSETVVFSWIVYKTKADRDRVFPKVMKDPKLKRMIDPKNMPFDAKRMFWGGFRVMVDL